MAAHIKAVLSPIIAAKDTPAAKERERLISRVVISDDEGKIELVARGLFLFLEPVPLSLTPTAPITLYQLDRANLSNFHPDFRFKLEHNIAFTEDKPENKVHVDENGKMCAKNFSKTSASAFDGILVMWACPHGFLVGIELMRARESVSRIAKTIITRFRGRELPSGRPD